MLSIYGNTKGYSLAYCKNFPTFFVWHYNAWSTYIQVDDRRSLSSIVVFLSANPISWSFLKQTFVSYSSIEVEYHSLANAAFEVSWVGALLDELHILIKFALVLWYDNLGAVSLKTNPILHSKITHVELDVHFVRERVMEKQLQVCYIPSEE